MKLLTLPVLAALLALPALHANPQDSASTPPATPKAPAASAAYPLTTCVVSDEALGGMGDPVGYLHKEEGKPDRLVKFCCKMCVSSFKKDPAKYLAKLDAAAAAKAAAPAADAAH